MKQWKVDEVIAMFDDGWLVCGISNQLGITEDQVRRALGVSDDVTHYGEATGPGRKCGAHSKAGRPDFRTGDSRPTDRRMKQ